MNDIKGKEKKAFTAFNRLIDDDRGKDTVTLDYGAGHRYVVFSDFHMGDKTGADNFRQNEKTLEEALKYYRREWGNHAIILLGDIEEFHQATLQKIFKKYEKSVYKELLRSIEKGNEVYRIFGNHDIDLSWTDPLSSEEKRTVLEGIRLKKGNDVHILLTHGHQAAEIYEEDLHIVRLGTTLVRYAERILRIKSKSIFMEAPSGKDSIYDKWAREKKKIIICGHTHCPVFKKHFIDYGWIVKKYEKTKLEYKEAKQNGDEAEIKRLKKRKEWLYYRVRMLKRRKEKGFPLPESPAQNLSTHYFNTGACQFRDAITNIEIDEDAIRLVYWYNKDQRREVFMEDEIPAILAQGI